MCTRKMYMAACRTSRYPSIISSAAIGWAMYHAWSITQDAPNPCSEILFLVLDCLFDCLRPDGPAPEHKSARAWKGEDLERTQDQLSVSGFQLISQLGACLLALLTVPASVLLCRFGTLNYRKVLHHFHVDLISTTLPYACASKDIFALCPWPWVH